MSSSEEEKTPAEGSRPPVVAHDKDSTKTTAAHVKSTCSRIGNQRTVIKLEKKRRLAGEESSTVPKLVFDDSTPSSASTSKGAARAPPKSGTADSSTKGLMGLSARASQQGRTYFGLSKEMQDAASSKSTVYQKNAQDPPSALLPRGLQFGTPTIVNRSNPTGEEGQIKDSEEELFLKKDKRDLDDYVDRIGNTRFIGDEERGTSLLYRKDGQPQTNGARDDGSNFNDSQTSNNEFLNWNMKTERHVRRRRLAQVSLVIVLVIVAVTLSLVLTKDKNSGSLGESSEDSKARTMPPRPVPPTPPVFDPTTIKTFNKTWDQDSLKSLLQTSTNSTLLEDAGTVQGKAFNWLYQSKPHGMHDERVQQRYVLAVTYYAFQGQSWTKQDGWLTAKHECTWHGVMCGNDGSNSFPVVEGPEGIGDFGFRQLSTDAFAEVVTYLNLSRNNLRGALPNEIKHLASLVQLVLSENYIEGSISKGVLSKFFTMHTLYLNGNFLTGQIPDEFNYLDFLRNLDLSGNSFRGAIPPTFRTSDDLVDWRLHDNELTGSIPDYFSKMPKLRVFSIGNNEMVGSIPSSLAESTSLVSLLLYENELSGSVPDFASTKLQLVHLDNNGFTGLLPSLRAFTTGTLQELHLEDNKFTGIIPTELGDHINLKLLWLDHNSLTGIVPRSICDLKLEHDLVSLRATCAGSNPGLTCSCCDC